MEFRQKVIVGCLLVCLLFVAACGTAKDTIVIEDTPEHEETIETTSGVTPGTTGAVAVRSADAKILTVTGENFKFVIDGNDNPDILVKQGDKVRIEFTSTSGFHDWVVDEFNARTEKVRPGNATFVEFTADKKGTFEYYCSVGSHRANGMKGNLIVE